MASTVRTVLLTADVEHLAAFYRGLLDAVDTDRFPGQGRPAYLGLRVGDSDLGVSVTEAAAAGEPGPPRFLLSVEVDDVDAHLARVEGLGGRVQGPATDMPWGQRVAHVTDPDGNTVNLTSSPA